MTAQDGSCLKKIKLDAKLHDQLELVARTIRGLSIDAVEAAKSGHPGLPLGCAQIGAYLFGHFLNQYPVVSRYFERDRFALSAGHGSMLLYSCLHLSGFQVSLDDIKKFRQLGSKTPGHPEFEHTDGVETTTGPLGQGIASAVGQAIGLKMATAQFELPQPSPKVIVLAGDGCMMEGISHEACALAGHFQLSNLILIYDSNHVCLDGPLNECCTEDVTKRFDGYGWDVVTINGHDLDEIHSALSPLREEQKRPTLIVAHTTIGYGSPNKQGTSHAHGSPLGPEEAIKTRKALGIPDELFFVPHEVKEYFTSHLEKQSEAYFRWLEKMQSWKKNNPDLASSFEAHVTKALPDDLEQSLLTLNQPVSVASRASSNTVIGHLAQKLPWIIGGSADLSCSDSTWIKGYERLSSENWKGRNIKFGVREFAMAGAASGLALTDVWTPFVGTFLTFSDYMRNAVRLSAMMKVQVIYQFTHDSIFLGEDGPTHQPIEHAMSLRAIPGLQVIRPGDAHEVAMGWLAALKYKGPTALILSRQSLPTLESTKLAWKEGMGRGAYAIYESSKKIDRVILATGSELTLALELGKALEEKGEGVRVVSMPCHLLFDQQDVSYKERLLGPIGTLRISLEAGTTLGWHKYIGERGLAVGIDTFGQSAPIEDLKKEFGFTVDAILKQLFGAKHA